MVLNPRSAPYLLLALTLVLLLLATPAQTQEPQPRDLSFIRLKQRFKIDIFAEVADPRQIVRSDKNTIFVSTFESGNGSVYAIKDTNGDHKADVIKVLATGLNMPNGVALRNGALYVAEVSRILRFDDIENNLDKPTFVVIKDDLPTETHHGWKFIDFGPDGKLYVPIGGPCNICDRGDPYATINRMNADGTGFQVVARGVRNSVGFDWDPNTKHLWFTDNGRDDLGDDIPPDQLNYAPSTGSHYGFPFCHGLDIKDPQFGTKDCSLYTPPKLAFDAHVAALGVNFYTHDSFPEKYRNGMFIAHHGSWNRKERIGYQVYWVKVEGDRVVESQVFADGWLQGQDRKGRPVDTEELQDGSLLVSDDMSGLIYRISYTPEPKPQEDDNTIKIIIIVVSVVAGVALLGAVGFFGFKAYQKRRLANQGYGRQVDAQV